MWLKHKQPTISPESVRRSASLKSIRNDVIVPQSQKSASFIQTWSCNLSLTKAYNVFFICCLPLSDWLLRNIQVPQTTERESTVLLLPAGTSSFLAARTGWPMFGILKLVRIMRFSTERAASLCSKVLTILYLSIQYFTVIQAAGCFGCFPGDQIAVYSELCYSTALRGVAFHPHENMVAFCAFGQSQPVHVYLYDRKGKLFPS